MDKIKFVRHCTSYKGYWDICYGDRVLSYVRDENLPKTALKFIAEASKITEGHDSIWGDTVTYEKR